MIDKQFGEFLLICDYCDEGVDEIFDEFGDVAKYKNKNGWKNIKTSKGWKDCCPECAKEYDT